MAHIIRPRPGEECHDYACGSAGLLVKLQLVCKELDPLSKIPLKLTGQELQAESYAMARMNGIIHDMELQLNRGDTMINPKFRTPEGKLKTFDIIVANPMWNQPFEQDIFTNDPYDRFRSTGGITNGKGDWAWLQHTFACLNEHGRAAVVLDTGAVTRGSGSKNDDKERSIRKWFVDNDFIDGVILLPDNLFYNTTASGVIIILNKRKPASRKNKIVLFNANQRLKKGKPKNYIPEENIRPIAAAYLRGQPIDGEMTIITCEQAEKTDYNLSPSRWILQNNHTESQSLESLIKQTHSLAEEGHRVDQELLGMLAKVIQKEKSDHQPYITLGELIDTGAIEAVVGFPCGEHNSDGDGVPHIRPFNINPNGKISLEQIKSIPSTQTINRPTLHDGDVIFNNTNTKELVGKCAVWEGNQEFVFSNHMTRIRTQNKTITNTYLNFAILHHWLIGKSEMLARAHVAQASIMGERFREIVLPQKNINEQTIIANLLTHIHRAISIEENRLAVLNKLFKILLHKLMIGEISISDLDLSDLCETTATKEPLHE